MENRYTPENITALADNEVFVFGSNLAGNHAGGAARVARERFGAVMGQGVGLQGRSYAIPTMQGGVETIRPYVEGFITFAKGRPQTKFYVTRIGCGIAGFKDEQIAPLFAQALHLENVFLPESFVNILRQGSFAKSYIDNWQKHYSSYDMAVDYLLLLNRLYVYGPQDMAKAMRDHEEILGQAMRSSQGNSHLLFIDTHDCFSHGIVNGLKLYLSNIERIIAHSDPSIVPYLRHMYSLTTEVAKEILEIHDWGKPDSATEDSCRYFSYALVCIITGRWNCGDNSYIYDDIRGAYPVFTKAVADNWQDMFVNDRMDERRIVAVFSGPYYWNSWALRAKHSQAIFRCVSPELKKLSYDENGSYLFDNRGIFVPRNNYSLPVFNSYQGRLHFPNFELKKAFIEHIKSELKCQ